MRFTGLGVICDLDLEKKVMIENWIAIDIGYHQIQNQMKRY